jgi:hypothetical protein
MSKADLLEIAVLTIGIADRPLARIRAREDRDLAAAIVIKPLHPPVSRRLAIFENLGLVWQGFSSGTPPGLASKGLTASSTGHDP